MFIKKLYIKGFRGLGGQEVRFDKRVAVVTGRNGHGKTSLIEAVYVLSQAKSFRTSKPKEMLAWGGNELDACGTVDTAVGEKKIQFQIRQGKKKLLINDKNVADAATFFGQFQVVEFTPDDIQLVSGAGAQRRRFIDRLIAMTDSGFVRDSLNYHAALKNRNALIIDSIKNKKNFTALAKAWDEQLAAYGLKISQKRLEFIGHFQPFFKESYRKICAGTQESVSIVYSGCLFEGGKLLSYDEVVNKYEHIAPRDIKYQNTTFGAHRDKVEIFLKTSGAEESLEGKNSQDIGTDARVYASQGQRKSIALAMKLAAVDFLQDQNPDGELPVLLLDDVDSELDSLRKKALYETILTAQNQIFISATEAGEWLDGVKNESQIFVVENGIFGTVVG